MMQQFLLMLGGGCFGAFAGYLMALERGRTQRRVQQELWDRKFRLSEADREAAVASLNQAQVDLQRARATRDGLQQEVQQLEGAQATAERALDRAEALQAEVGQLRAEQSATRAKTAQSEADHRALTEQHEQLQRRLRVGHFAAQQLAGERRRAGARVEDLDKALTAAQGQGLAGPGGQPEAVFQPPRRG